MKHSFPIISTLLLLFFSAQAFGLVILNNYVDYSQSLEQKTLVLRPLPFAIERPEVAPEYSFAYILSGVLVATALILLLIKYGQVNIWKFWYLLSVVFCLLVAAGAFFSDNVSFLLALVFGTWKVFRPNVIVHNLTELLIYGGLVVVFAPVLTFSSVVLLLVLISCYDMYAVWKSKHMVTMAHFLAETRTFAGLFLPYQTAQVPAGAIPVKGKIRNAVLGGGDIAFPLLFTSVVFKELLLGSVVGFYWKLLIVPLAATIALALLFAYSKKDVFYPAMPFLSAGCFVGYGLVWLML
ncbi:hypothetical protein HY639_05020 [Candidatus Woesearchaeota archaeon]|nr:hypothetical protein [Candidatus Woesearchaeota archaeon]